MVGNACLRWFETSLGGDGGIRTLTGGGLSALPLPVGLRPPDYVEMQEETQAPQDEHSNWEIEAIDVCLSEAARVTYPIDSSTDASRSPNRVWRISLSVVDSPVGRKEPIGWDPPRDRIHGPPTPPLPHRHYLTGTAGTIAGASA